MWRWTCEGGAVTTDTFKVTVSFHHLGQTFAPKTLKPMIEMRARGAKAAPPLKLIK